MLLALILPLLPPLLLSIRVIVFSIIITKELFIIRNSSWLSLVLILTFSSGIITLFVYAASLAPNEKKSKTSFKIILLCGLLPILSQITLPKQIHFIKTFSSRNIIVLIVLILLLVIITITRFSFHPNQTLSSSF